jgi:hypothetical protein
MLCATSELFIVAIFHKISIPFFLRVQKISGVRSVLFREVRQTPSAESLLISKAKIHNKLHSQQEAKEPPLIKQPLVG